MWYRRREKRQRGRADRCGAGLRIARANLKLLVLELGDVQRLILQIDFYLIRCWHARSSYARRSTVLYDIQGLEACRIPPEWCERVKTGGQSDTELPPWVSEPLESICQGLQLIAISTSVSPGNCIPKTCRCI
jgi:hypothetical protein